MSNTKIITLIAAAAVLLGGCANQNSQMDRGAVYDKNKAFKSDKVSFVDDMDVLVSDMKTVKENGFLKVMVEFMNESSGDNKRFVYKIEWLDKNGMPKDSTSWRPVNVVGNQKIKVVEMATMPEITDYKLIIAIKE
ncbi:MAG: YcfL family protein [Campylobacterales bacterium]|nr:YcfL family protein [Campylobacterales bacterium]